MKYIIYVLLSCYDAQFISLTLQAGGKCPFTVTVTERKQSYSQMPDTELCLAYDPAILIIVTDQTPVPNIRCKLEFVEINEN